LQCSPLCGLSLGHVLLTDSELALFPPQPAANSASSKLALFQRRFDPTK